MSTLLSTDVREHPRLPQWPYGPISHMTLYWALFSLSILAFVLNYLVGDLLPHLRPWLHVAGLVPCGFSWLLSRSLFRADDKSEIWPPVVVAALFITCLVSYFDVSDTRSGLVGYLGEFQALLGSAVLLLGFVEPLNSRGSTGKERRFRRTVAIAYAALVATAFVFDLPEFLGGQEAAQAVLATIALVGATGAWRYRLRNPLPGAKKTTASVAPNPVLAASIVTALEDQKLFLNPEIKVADLAKVLEQQIYKVSQCIVNDLGYPNFNQLINHYRLEAAIVRLSQPLDADLPVLTIALDCGFGSIGPFNRAFKAKTGVTPTAFRKAALEAPAPT